MASQPGSSNPNGLEEFIDPRTLISPVIEFDPGNPVPRAEMVTEAPDTVDTLALSSELLVAQGELERELAGIAGLPLFAAGEAHGMPYGAEQVVGTSIGFCFVHNVLVPEPTLKVLVTPRRTSQGVPLASLLPSHIQDVPVTVEEVGAIAPQMLNRHYPRPVQCGVSIAHPRVASGTLGCLVVLSNNRLCILSSNHLLANTNRARIGDAILQPGPSDGGLDPRDRIGVLENFVRIEIPGPNQVDAAVAWTSYQNVSPDQSGYKLHPIPVTPRLGMTVSKQGRTTGATLGVITDLSVNIRVGYPIGVAEFRNQIGIRGIGGVFSQSGDSGALIVTANTRQPVALLFAGASDHAQSFANPIGGVIAALGIRRFVHTA